MKRKFVLLFLVLVLAAICIIPISQEKTIPVKSPFINTFVQLQTAKNWKKWRSDLRKVAEKDSNKITTKSVAGHFTINYADLVLNVKLNDGSFNVNEQDKKGSMNYNLVVLPDKIPVNSFIVVKKTLPLAKYVYGFFKDDLAEKTHVTDLKQFLETDSLHYGYNIFKSTVPGTKLVVMRKTVLAKYQFDEAAKMQSTLNQFVKNNDVKKTDPLIAQFIASDKDSVQITVGFYIDKIVKGGNGINFEQMPKNGPGYTVNFHGKFNKRLQVYSAIRAYLADHSSQAAILPFDIYLDDKLPTSDTSKINIQAHIATFD